MSASLADQPGCLAVALGANLSSPVGSPLQTLQAVRPRLERLLSDWSPETLRFQWSPLLETAPVGGPSGQPAYLNAVLLAVGLIQPPQHDRALALLEALHALERDFGRDRSREERWGPRSLDLDFLFWDALRMEHPLLVLPHPRLHLRPFVLEPLLAAMQGSARWEF